MTQTRPQPIPRSPGSTAENVHVEWIDPVPPPSNEAGMFETWADALSTIFALVVVVLGLIAAAGLLGWSMFKVADFLGLLSS